MFFSQAFVTRKGFASLAPITLFAGIKHVHPLCCLLDRGTPTPWKQPQTMSLLGKLKWAVMGNPVTREYEIGRHIASAGPGLLWRVHQGNKKSTRQVVREFVCCKFVVCVGGVPYFICILDSVTVWDKLLFCASESRSGHFERIIILFQHFDSGN